MIVTIEDKAKAYLAKKGQTEIHITTSVYCA